MLEIDPSDVLPARNLPNAAEPWGRAVDTRLVTAEKAILGNRSALQSSNRTSAAQLSMISQQFQALQEAFTRMAESNSVDTIEFTANGVNGWPVSRGFTPPAWARYGVVSSQVRYLSGSNSGLHYLYVYGGTAVQSTSGNQVLSSYVVAGSSVGQVEGTYSPALVPIGPGDTVMVEINRSRSTAGSGNIIATLVSTITWIA